MSIRPVDMQIVLPKTMETAKTGQNSARPDLQTQHFAQEMQKHVQIESQQVQQLNKSEKNSVDKDGRNKQQQEERKKRQAKRRELERKELERKNGSTSMFDISI